MFNVCESVPRRMAEENARLADPWSDWKRDVVAVIRHDFREVLDDIGESDVDWDAWRSLYDQGCSPAAAVNRALWRDM